MSSRSFINLCAALTLTRFTAEVILKDVPDDRDNRKLRRLCDRIVEHVHACRDLWPFCTQADLVQITRRIEYLGDEILQGERDVVELIALALTMLVDMQPRLRGARAVAIDQLTDLVQRLNSEFDRQLVAHEAYDYAGRAAERWYWEVMG